MDDMTCSDCGFPVDPKTAGPKAIARGSSVRDPGEVVCPSCTSSRVRLMRSVDAIPNSLDKIQAQRGSVSLLQKPHRGKA